ncbi:MAG: glycosyltransferase [Bacteroidota bacterium]
MQRIRSKIKSVLDGETQTLFKNSVWVFVSNMYGVLLAFLRSIVIARGLGAEILGIYSVIIAFVLTIQEVIKLNVPLGIIKFGAQFISHKAPEKVVSLLKRGLLYSMLSALLSVIVIWIISHFLYDHFFDIKGLQKFIILYALVNGICFLDNIGRAVLKIYYRFKVNSIVQIIMDTVEFVAITLSIYYFPNNLDYFFYTVISTKLLNSIICNLSVVIELRKDLLPYLNTPVSAIKSHYSEIRHFIFGNSFGNTLKTLLSQGDILLLNLWGTHAAVGFYTVSKKLAYAILTITDPLVTSIYPQLAHLVALNKWKELKTMMGRITRISLIPSAVATLIIFLFKGEIITFVYGPSFIKSVPTFFVHFVGAASSSVLFWGLPLMQGLNLTNKRIKVYLFAIIINFIIAFYLTPILGPIGVASGLVCANLFINFSFAFYCLKKINRKIYQTEGKHETIYIYLSPYDILRPRTNQLSDVRFCDGFIQNERKVHLVVPFVNREDNITKEEVFENYGISPKLDIHYLNTNFHSDVKGKLNVLKMVVLNYFKIKSLTKEKNKNYIVVSRSLAILFPFLVFKMFMRKNLKFTYWAHDFSKKKWVHWSYLQCDNIIATNSSIINSIYQLTNYPLHRTITSSNPITQQQADEFTSKLEARDHLNINHSKQIVVYTGKLAIDYHLEIEYILKAAKRLPDVDFILTGGKPLAVEYWKEWCDDQQIKNVMFTGYLHNYQKIKYYQFAADILVSYYTKQGHDVNYNFPNKICEYMLTGNPIITPNYAATQDILNAHNCYFVAPENDAELAKTIMFALSNKEQSSVISAQAKFDVKQNTFKIRVKNIIDFLETNDKTE